jgi:hypothetical protein
VVELKKSTIPVVGRVTPLSRMLLGGCLMTFPKIYTSFTHHDEIALDGLGTSSSFPNRLRPWPWGHAQDFEPPGALAH